MSFCSTPRPSSRRASNCAYLSSQCRPHRLLQRPSTCEVAPSVLTFNSAPAMLILHANARCIIGTHLALRLVPAFSVDLHAYSTAHRHDTASVNDHDEIQALRRDDFPASPHDLPARARPPPRYDRWYAALVLRSEISRRGAGPCATRAPGRIGEDKGFDCRGEGSEAERRVKGVQTGRLAGSPDVSSCCRVRGRSSVCCVHLQIGLFAQDIALSRRARVRVHAFHRQCTPRTGACPN